MGALNRELLRSGMRGEGPSRGPPSWSPPCQVCLRPGAFAPAALLFLQVPTVGPLGTLIKCCLLREASSDHPLETSLLSPTPGLFLPVLIFILCFIFVYLLITRRRPYKSRHSGFLSTPSPVSRSISDEEENAIEISCRNQSWRKEMFSVKCFKYAAYKT